MVEMGRADGRDDADNYPPCWPARPAGGAVLPDDARVQEPYHHPESLAPHHPGGTNQSVLPVTARGIAGPSGAHPRRGRGRAGRGRGADEADRGEFRRDVNRVACCVLRVLAALHSTQHTTHDRGDMSTHMRGAGGAPGIVLGRAARYFPPPAAPALSEADPEMALKRFAEAQAAAAAQLRALAERLRGQKHADEAGIFDAQALLVEDMFLSDEVARRVRDEGAALEPAIAATTAQMREMLAALDDPHLRERAADMDAIGQAILAALRGEASALRDLPPGAIIVAADLTPAETAGLQGGEVAGFATAYGGPAGHTAVPAPSFCIPPGIRPGAAA